MIDGYEGLERGLKFHMPRVFVKSCIRLIYD